MCICLFQFNAFFPVVLFINYTAKIDTFVCPPDISQNVAFRIMKLAHRPRIASTTNKLISKPILLSVLSILFKTIQRIGAALATRSANRCRHLIRPTPFPVSVTQPRRSGKMLSLKTALCDYQVWMTETGATVRVKPFSQSYYLALRQLLAEPSPIVS